MPPDFPRKFISREEELAALDTAWASAKEGRPKFVLLLGDSGLGKTRLVHEFYKRLSAAERANGNQYWPPELDPPESLRVNPRLSGEHSTAAIPWLWWGLRWLEPNLHADDARRACALRTAESREVLSPHIDALDRWQKQHRRAHDILKRAGEVALSPIPFATPIIELWKLFSGAKEWGAGREPDRRIDYDADSAERLREADATAMRIFSSFLDPTEKELPTVPAVLFLDDAQWADPVTLRFAVNLFEQAARNRWPLLIVATHWETDWLEGAAVLSPAQPVIDKPPNLNVAIEELARRLPPSGPTDFRATHWEEIRVTRFADYQELTPLVEAACPELRGEPVDYLLRVAAGNPKVLVELLRQWQERSAGLAAWFHSDGNVNETGLGKLLALPIKHEDILQTRLNRLRQEDPDVFAAVAWSGVQGLRFFGKVTTDLAKLLWPLGQFRRLIPAKVRHYLAQAEKPRNLIVNRVGELSPAEFQETLACELMTADFTAEQRDSINAALREVLAAWFADGRLLATEEAPVLCELLLKLLDVAVSTDASHGALRVAVAAELVAWFFAHGRLAEAISYGEKAAGWLLAAEASSPVDLPGATLATLARTLFHGHRHDTAIAVADAALGRQTLDAPSRFALCKTRAKALLARERYEDAILAFGAALEALAATDCSAAERRGQEARIYTGLGFAELKRAHKRDGFRHYHRAFRLISPKVPPAGDPPPAQRVVGLALQGVSSALRDAGRLILGVKVLRVALECFGSAVTAPAFSPSTVCQYAAALNDLGTLQMRGNGGTAQHARVHFAQSLEMLELLRRQLGKVPEILAGLASAKSNLAWADTETGDLAFAQTCADEAVALREELLLRLGREPDLLRDLSLSLKRRADIARKWQPPDWQGALDDLNTALRLREEILEKAGPRESNLRLLSYAWRFLGEVQLEASTVEKSNAAGALDSFAQARVRLDELAQVLAASGAQQARQQPLLLRDSYVVAWLRARAAAVLGLHEEALAAACDALATNELLMHDYKPTDKTLADHEKLISVVAQLTAAATP